MTLMRKLIICLMGFCGIACEPAVEPIRTFIIREGEHYASQRSAETLQSSVLSFRAKFDHTAVYDFGDLALQTNKNKLLGFSDCNSMHHENSARFAWQWFNNRLEVYAYCYVNSRRVEEYVGAVSLDQYSSYQIEILPTEYIFRLNDEPPVRIQRGNVRDLGLYYMLWPYFGGSIPAPHDVKIEVMMQ